MTALYTTLIFLFFDFFIRLALPSHNQLTGLSFLLSLITSLSFWAMLRFLQKFLPAKVQWYYSVLISFFITGLAVSSFFMYWKMGDFINSYHLAFLSSDLSFATDQIKLYALSVKGLALVPLFLAFIWIWKPKKINSKSKVQLLLKKTGYLFGFTFCLALALVGVQQLKFETVGHHKTPDASFLLALKNFKNTTQFNVLRSSVREPVQAVTLTKRPPDILLFVGESLGKQHMTVYGNTSKSDPTFTQIFSDKNSVAFNHALTNSSATDVSLPSLLSSVGPEESDVKLHELPLLWDWLRKAGYYTVFVSPQKFSFSSMDNFFMSPGPDRLLTADRFNDVTRMVTHNNGIDDILAAKLMIEEIQQKVPRTTPLFVLYFSNATHFPFLETSTELKQQPKFSTKYENSQFISDMTLKTLFSFMSERKTPLLTVVSSDHGEIENHTRPVPRISSFYDEILSIPYMFSANEEYSAYSDFKSCLKNMTQFKNATVQNLDLLPTLVDLIGLRTKENEHLFKKLSGRSLCRIDKTSANSSVIIALNTNNIRQWNPEGFLIAKNNFRFVFTNTEGSQIFDISKDKDQKNNLFAKNHPFYLETVLPTIQANLHLNRIWQQWGPKD